MAKSTSPEIDKDWQAEQDARDLAKPQEIKEDKNGSAKALKAAQKIVDDAQKILKANLTIAGKKYKVKVSK